MLLHESTPPFNEIVNDMTLATSLSDLLTCEAPIQYRNILINLSLEHIQ